MENKIKTITKLFEGKERHCHFGNAPLRRCGGFGRSHHGIIRLSHNKTEPSACAFGSVLLYV